MKKVININFQGRVIPIEETAYDILQQYIDSLRKYFANEEGRDEIINDIEGRIAELFSERLKKGTTCITDEDVNAVIASMGRPSDFEQAEAEGTGPTTASASTGSTGTSSQQQSEPSYAYVPRGRGRLYRNADDKLIAGVCSGLANYLGIDPVVMRILFVVFIGALFWVYIILWIIVPSQSAQSNITKRLYRSTDDKVIGGVCGGLAAYFNISTWIPRLIFALPLIIGIISGPFNFWLNDWEFWWGPKVVTGSFGFTLFVTYIILWISVPVAVTAAEKLEMRGERVDLNSIRDTVKEDLESFKSKAQNFGAEVKQTAQQFGEKAKTFGQTAGTQAKTYATEAAPMVRRTGSNLGHVIGILFKAFFLFIAGIIAISLFGVLMGLLFGGFVIFPFKDFVLEGFWQNTLAWLALILFLGVPIVGLITWLIRRIIGVRSRNNYLSYVFGSLWTIGLISAIILAGMFSRNFKTGSEKQEEVTGITQPGRGKLYVDVATSNVRYYGGDWYGIEWNDMPFYGVNQDTLMLNTIRVHVVKSRDSFYHVHKVNFSRGHNPEAALSLAERIRFDITQQDSTLILPKGFPISRSDKFRNQRVLVVIAVPEGKKIQLDESIYSYEWFTVNFNRRRGWNVDNDDYWDDNYRWEANVEYIMTKDGLRRTDRKYNAEGQEISDDDTTTENFKTSVEAKDVKVTIEGKVERDSKSKTGDYRYQDNNQQKPVEKKDSTTKSQEDISQAAIEQASDKKESSEIISPIYMLGRIAR
ncbi:MAG: PspC domain-containing protein [Chitinophagaceae bacterium]